MEKTKNAAVNSEPAGDRLVVNTPLGQLVAYPSVDPAHPGIYIDLKRDGCECAAPTAMVEYTADDTSEDGHTAPASIVCRVWGDAMQEDYTYAAACANLDEYFQEPSK